MGKTVSTFIFILTFVSFIYSGPADTDFGLGADICNRYVWRGTDFGNSPAIQPWLSFSIGAFEIGAWSSWSITGAPGGNENDLYLNYTHEKFFITVSDYFFPGYTGDDSIDDFSETGTHTFELSCGSSFRNLSVMGAVNLLGNDPDYSKYIEFNYCLFQKDEVAASVIAGAGDNIYTTDASFAVVNAGLTLTKDRYTASYLINPNQKTSFMVFMVSF